MGLVFGLGEDAPELARARQRPHQKMGVTAPRGLGQLVPVPLDLLWGAAEYAADGAAASDPCWSKPVRGPIDAT
jgi:hypothetical protein